MSLFEKFSPNTTEVCENIMTWSRRVGIGSLAIGGALVGADALLDFMPNAGDVAVAVMVLFTSAESAALHSRADRSRSQIASIAMPTWRTDERD